MLDIAFYNTVALVLFLIANLVVASRSFFSKKKSVETMADYAVASGRLGGGVLTISLFATVLEAGKIGIVGPYRLGIAHFLHPFALTFFSFLMGWFLLPKLVNFSGHYSIASVMEHLYGYVGGLITAVVVTLFSFLVCSAQLQALKLLAPLMNVSPTTMIIVMGTLVTLYTVVGGVRSVIATDVLQFAIVVSSFLFLGTIVLKNIGGLGNLFNQLPQDSHIELWHHPRLKKICFHVFFWSVWPSLLISPPIIQRVLMTPKKEQIRSMFLNFSFLFLLLRILMGVLGLALLVSYPGKKFSSSSKLVDMLCASAGKVYFQPIVVLLICSVVMSTLDSFLNTLSVLWMPYVHALERRFNKRNKLSEVQMARLLALFFGILCTTFAVVRQGSIVVQRRYATMLFSMITVPFLVGIAGLKGHRSSFLGAVVSFLSVYVFMILFKYYETSGAFHIVGLWCLNSVWPIALGVSLMTFFSTHYIVHDYHFVFVDRATHGWQVNRQHSISNIFSWLKHTIKWEEEHLKGYRRMPYLFALFIYGTFLIPTIYDISSQKVVYIILCMRSLGLLFCGMLLAESAWPEGMKRYFNRFYLFTIFHCVPLTSSTSQTRFLYLLFCTNLIRSLGT